MVNPNETYFSPFCSRVKLGDTRNPNHVLVYRLIVVVEYLSVHVIDHICVRKFDE